MMPLALVLVLVSSVGEPPAEAPQKPGLPPVALLLTLEVEDMERDMGRQRETVASSRQRLAATQRLGARGSASPDELEQEAADARYQDARLTEMTAVRDLKASQRDVLAGVAPRDEAREFDLVLAVFQAQEATARVEADFRAYRQRQARLLLLRNAVSREFKSNADVDAENALAGVTLMVVRQARLAREFARRPKPGQSDPREIMAREIAWLRATLDHDRQLAALARARTALARDRPKSPNGTGAEVETLRQAAADAEALASADQEALDRAQAPPPPPRPAPTP